MFKRAVAVWTKVPGLPFTIPGNITQYERLPGMSEWAPRDVITRASEGLRAGNDPQELVEEEKNRGMGKDIALGAASGGVGGGLLGRLVSGEAATAPVREMLAEGTGASLRGLRNLGKIPTAAKVLTLGGMGVGALGGLTHWGTNVESRGESAKDALRGLKRERLMLNNAQLQNEVLKKQLLKENPAPSATASQPLVAQTGKAI